MSDRSRSPVRERERSPVRERERSRSNSRDRERVPPPRDEAPVDTEPTKLFIGNLSFDTTDRDLEDAFSKYGNVSEVRVITDRDTGRPRGFGFVTFKDQKDADDALAGMNGVDLQGREIRVDKSTPRGAGPRGDRGGDRGGYQGGRGGDRGGYQGGGGGGAGACYSFQRGDCRYGDSCRFSHEGAGGGGAGGRDDRRGGYDDRRGGGGYDDRRGGGGYDDRRGGGGYDDRRGGGGYDDRRGGGGYDRGRDDRRGGDRDRY